MAGERKLISIVDPAVDWKRMGPEKQLEYRRKRKLEMLNRYFLTDKRPVIFHLRELRHRHMQYVDRGTQAERALAAFQFAVVNVENLRTDDDRLLPFVALERPPGEEAIREEVLDRYFDWDQLQEIGWLAYQHAFLARKTDASYQLPDSLVELWIQMALASAADASPSSPDPSSDGTSPAETATTLPSSSSIDERSDNPTPATAAVPSTAAA